MAYTGPSIVDYLSSTGKDSSFSARKLLAEQMGVQNYTGTGNQNTQLLTSLRHLLTKPETAPQEQRTLQPASEMQNESRLLNVPDPNAGYNPPPQQPSMPSPTPINTPTKPVDLFNKTLEEMMKAAQSSNNEDLMSKRNAIIQARFNAGRETTPEELRVLSPQAQSSLRNLNQSGLEDQLSGVNTAIQGREAKLKNEQTAKQGILDALLKKQQLDAPAKENLPSSVQEYEYAKKNGYNGSFTDYQNDDANRKLRIEKANIAGIDPSLANIGISYGTKFDTSPIVKQFNEVQNKKLGVDQIVNSSQTGPGDVALIYDFMKALDPTSVVRESEYATAAQSGNIFTGALAKFNGMFSEKGGKLSPEVRKEFQNIINQKYNVISKQYDNLYDENTRKMKSLGIDDPTLFLTNYGQVTENTNSSNVGDYKGKIQTALSQGYQPQQIIDFLKKDQNLSGKISEAEKNGYTSQQIIDYVSTFNQPLSTGLNGLGAAIAGGQLGVLAKKYESGGNPGAIGYDSTGGYSYGTYQLAHNSAQQFINQSSFKQDFNGLTFNSPQWRQKWQEVAKQSPEKFAKAQEDYIANNWYVPVAKKAEQMGVELDNYSPVLKNVIFSTAIQHGAGTDVVNKALAKVGKNASEADLIKAIYNERWSGGSRFANSTPQVKQAVYNRFFGVNGELNTALSLLS